MPASSPLPGAAGQSGTQRLADTRATAPPTVNPPPEKPCGLEAPNFSPYCTKDSTPDCDDIDDWSLPRAAVDGRSRTSLRPAATRAALTWDCDPGCFWSRTSTPWSLMVTGVPLTDAPSTTVVATPLGS